MPSTLSILLQTNQTLAKRIKSGKWFYLLWTVVISLLILSFSLVTIFQKNIKPSDYRDVFNMLAMFVVAFDLGAIVFRFRTRALIEPHQVQLFPLSKWQKLSYHIILFLADFKNLLYLAAIIGSILIFTVKGLFLASFLSIFIWLFLLLTVFCWIMVVYQVFGNYLTKYRHKLDLINLVIMGIILLPSLVGNMRFVSKTPVIGFAATSLFGLLTGNLSLYGINLLYLVISLGLALMAYRFAKSYS